MDMSAPYQKGVAENCRNAQVVFDKFHVLAKAGQVQHHREAPGGRRPRQLQRHVAIHPAPDDRLRDHREVVRGGVAACREIRDRGLVHRRAALDPAACRKPRRHSHRQHQRAATRGSASGRTRRSVRRQSLATESSAALAVDIPPP